MLWLVLCLTQIEPFWGTILGNIFLGGKWKFKYTCYHINWTNEYLNIFVSINRSQLSIQIHIPGKINEYLDKWIYSKIFKCPNICPSLSWQDINSLFVWPEPRTLNLYLNWLVGRYSKCWFSWAVKTFPLTTLHITMLNKSEVRCINMLTYVKVVKCMTFLVWMFTCQCFLQTQQNFTPSKIF